MDVKRALVGRPLPLQVPTAFVRIRRRGLRLCGEARTEQLAAARRRKRVVAELASAHPRYAPRVFITFLSDFGLKDDFVGTCHGVMKTIAPEAQIIDITHGIPPQAVLEGALVLANTIAYMPVGVHLAVVDPGVGGPRRPLALRDEAGGSSSAPTTGSCSLRPAGRASRRRTSSPIRSTRCKPSRARSTGGISSAQRLPTSRTESPLAELGPPCTWRRLSVSMSRSRSRRTACSSRRCSTSTASGTSRSI